LDVGHSSGIFYGICELISGEQALSYQRPVLIGFPCIAQQNRKSASFDGMEKNDQFDETFCTAGDLDGRGPKPTTEGTNTTSLVSRLDVPVWRIILSLVLLFLNYFLAQYDKFVLSYFQKDVIASLSLSSPAYGILSGYATGVVYALLALPAAYVADYTDARVWVLTVSALWWSLCAIFQGLSHTFWQILLARIGMGIGQAPVEALSVSLISDLMGKKYVFFGERYELVTRKRSAPFSWTNVA